MDSEKDQTADSKDSEAHHDQATEPVIETVARGIGTAMGVVATTAAKVIGKSESAEPESKPKEKPKKSAAKQHAAPGDASNKYSAGRIAKKRKKRAAHRIKLKRSNTKG
jgi:hypothetical protein